MYPREPVIDAAAHPAVAREGDLRAFMPQPWRSRPFAQLDRFFYPAPDGEYWEPARPADGLPGSDPVLLRRQLLDEAGGDVAILLPPTRGLHPNVQLANALRRATNDRLPPRGAHTGKAPLRPRRARPA